jgi:hypothetical protein
MTILRSGCRLVVAPRFQMLPDWSRRLRVGAGLEATDGSFFPLLPWRPPTTDELALLVHDASREQLSVEDLESSLCLFQLPEHLWSRWWNLLESAAGVLGNGDIPGFDLFADQVREFLAFKRLPVPNHSRFDVVITNPTRTPGAEEPCQPYQWGGINLGDDETCVVVVNLSCQQREMELRRRFPAEPLPAIEGKLAGQFLRYCSDYPPIGLMLAPGEGYRLPRGGLLLGQHVGDKCGPDISLTISSGASPQVK